LLQTPHAASAQTVYERYASIRRIATRTLTNGGGGDLLLSGGGGDLGDLTAELLRQAAAAVQLQGTAR